MSPYKVGRNSQSGTACHLPASPPPHAPSSAFHPLGYFLKPMICSLYDSLTCGGGGGEEAPKIEQLTGARPSAPDWRARQGLGESSTPGQQVRPSQALLTRCAALGASRREWGGVRCGKHSDPNIFHCPCRGLEVKGLVPRCRISFGCFEADMQPGAFR